MSQKRKASTSWKQSAAKRTMTTAQLRKASAQRRQLYSNTNPVSRNQGNHGIEKKNLTIADAAYECSTTGTITMINYCALGTTNLSRVGNKITIKSILIRGVANVGSTATSAPTRWMLVYDKQPNGDGTAAITDILTSIKVQSPMNLTNPDRFVVLADNIDYVEATGASSKPFKHYMKCNLETVYNGNGGTDVAVSTGAIYLLSVGNTATGVTSPILTITARCRFTDN